MIVYCYVLLKLILSLKMIVEEIIFIVFLSQVYFLIYFCMKVMKYDFKF